MGAIFVHGDLGISFAAGGESSPRWPRRDVAGLYPRRRPAILRPVRDVAPVDPRRRIVGRIKRSRGLGSTISRDVIEVLDRWPSG